MCTSRPYSILSSLLHCLHVGIWLTLTSIHTVLQLHDDRTVSFPSYFPVVLLSYGSLRLSVIMYFWKFDTIVAKQDAACSVFEWYRNCTFQGVVTLVVTVHRTSIRIHTVPSQLSHIISIRLIHCKGSRVGIFWGQLPIILPFFELLYILWQTWFEPRYFRVLPYVLSRGVRLVSHTVVHCTFLGLVTVCHSDWHPGRISVRLSSAWLFAP